MKRTQTNARMLRSFEKNACPTLVTRFSTSRFFHDSNPSGPLINRPKYFRIQLRFCQDIQIFKIPRCAAYGGVKLCGVHPTAESSSAVCITPWSQVMKSSPKTPRCASHCGVRLLGLTVHHTKESRSAVCITLRSQ